MASAAHNPGQMSEVAMFQQLAVNGCMVTHRRHTYGYQREAWGIILPLGLDSRAEAVLEGDQR